MKPVTRILLFLAATAPLATPLEATLVHQYKFDETSGTVALDSVGTQNGDIGSGVTLNQPGRLGKSFQFPATAAGASSRVQLPVEGVPGTAFSMPAFYNRAAPLGNGQQMHIISGNTGGTGRWSIGLNDNDNPGPGIDPRLFWFHSGGAGYQVFSTPIANVAGEWVHVGITRDDTGVTRLYLNGVGMDIGSSTEPLASTPIGIGERPNASQFQFNGRIDAVRFYDTALTDAQMAAAAAENEDTDMDGLADSWEIQYFGNLSQNGDNDPDSDGFNNRIEFAAGTDPTLASSFPTGDSDNDGLDDGYEYLNFGSLEQTGSGDFDGDGSLNSEEFEATAGILIARNANGSVSGTTAFTGSSSSKDPNSQPNSDGDTLPDGYEYKYFFSLAETAAGDFDADGFTNGAEFLANSLPTRKASTPDNVHATTRVAVSDNLGIEEFSVTDRVWTYVRRIAPITGGVYGVTSSSDGFLYAATLETAPRIIRVDPASGAVTTLATRNTGAAVAAGWIASNPQGIRVGPDGKIYFSTAFGSPAGEGVFRVNKDGTGFQNFIARTGGTAPDDWALNNARDLQFIGNDLYVSARNANAIYHFNSAGGFVSLLSNVAGAQGLALEEDGLLAAGNSVGVNSLVLVDPNGVPPVVSASRAIGGTPVILNVIDLNGDTYSITFGSGPGGTVGQILRHQVTSPYPFTVVVNALPDRGNDLTIFTSSGGGDPYIAFATANGLDPNSPNGSRTGDFDGDGTRNEVEFALGLNPKDGTSRFAVTTSGTPATGITLTWPSQPGVVFEVRSSTDLVDFSTVEATVTGQPSMTTASFTVPAASGPRRFYRVQFKP